MAMRRLLSVAFLAKASAEPGCYNMDTDHSVDCCVLEEDCPAPKMWYADYSTGASACTTPCTHAGSCYSNSIITCDVAPEDCTGYAYPVGKVGGSGCCHCLLGCDHSLETVADWTTDCEYGANFAPPTPPTPPPSPPKAPPAGACFDPTTDDVTCGVGSEADCPSGEQFKEAGSLAPWDCCWCGANCDHSLETGVNCTDNYADVAHGACYNNDNQHTVECGFREDECTGDPGGAWTGYYYGPGYIHNGGCCMCEEGCHHSQELHPLEYCQSSYTYCANNPDYEWCVAGDPNAAPQDFGYYDHDPPNGACYNMVDHSITCDSKQFACETSEVTSMWLEPGYVSSNTGCCSCQEGCNHTLETGTECTYPDSSAGSCVYYNYYFYCNREPSSCRGSFYDPGYIAPNGCCHCNAGCDHSLETGDDCRDQYYDNQDPPSPPASPPMPPGNPPSPPQDCIPVDGQPLASSSQVYGGQMMPIPSDPEDPVNEPCYSHSRPGAACATGAVCCVAIGTCTADRNGDGLGDGTTSSNPNYYEGGCRGTRYPDDPVNPASTSTTFPAHNSTFPKPCTKQGECVLPFMEQVKGATADPSVIPSVKPNTISNKVMDRLLAGAAETFEGACRTFYPRLCPPEPDFDGDGYFRLGDAVFTSEVWSGGTGKMWDTDDMPCGNPPGDFDEDGIFRLADGVMVAEVWGGVKEFAAVVQGYRRSLDEALRTYGSLAGLKKEGQTMQVHAFIGTNPVIKVGTTDVEWKTVEVAFSGGTVVSAVAEHGLTAVVQGTTVVAVGDLSGSGKTFPSGLAMTVTFSADTNMDDVTIDFKSAATTITIADPSAHPAVTFQGTTVVGAKLAN